MTIITRIVVVKNNTASKYVPILPGPHSIGDVIVVREWNAKEDTAYKITSTPVSDQFDANWEVTYEAEPCAMPPMYMRSASDNRANMKSNR